jgi:hypothetical protein
MGPVGRRSTADRIVDEPRAGGHLSKEQYIDSYLLQCREQTHRLEEVGVLGMRRTPSPGMDTMASSMRSSPSRPFIFAGL